MVKYLIHVRSKRILNAIIYFTNEPVQLNGSNAAQNSPGQPGEK